MKTPYIGITDFTSPEQARNMLAVFSSAWVDAVWGNPKLITRRLMVGVMMSYKTLNHLPTKWSAAFPPEEEVEKIFIRKGALFNTLHYADYDGICILENLLVATNLGGPNMHAIQLDMVWPDSDLIKEYRENHPKIRVVIQVNKVALEQINNDPQFLIQRLKDYGDSIDYALLDKSMGRGLGMDEKALRPFVQELAENMPELGIAVAGGLGPNTIHLVQGLVRDYPQISIDAQGQLRRSGNALDPIEWDMATEYIQKAVGLFQKSQAVR